MEILATYNSYKNHIGKYKDWKNKQDLELSKRCALTSSGNKNCFYDSDVAKKKAKIVADSTLILDDYAQTKAEDVEAVFQTLEIELLAALTALVALPDSVSKVIPMLEKKAKNGNIAEKLAKSLNNYQNKTIKLFKKEIPLPKTVKYALFPLVAALYVPTVTKFVKNQLGATRRAKFDVMHHELSDPRDFAILTPEQEAQVNSDYKVESSKKKHAPVLKKILSSVSDSVGSIFDAVNIPKMLKTVRNLNEGTAQYKANRAVYDKELFENEKQFKTELTPEQKARADADKTLLNDVVKAVDIDTMDDVERIDKIVNIGYGSLFMGGFLEYLLTDKIIEVLGNKSAIMQKALGHKSVNLALKLGIPFAAYMLLNKALASLQNNALKAIRYKHLKDFVNNDKNFKYYDKSELDKVPDSSSKVENKPKKQNLFKFMESIFKDIKEYKQYKKSQFIEDKEKMKLKRNIKLSPQQITEAKDLQRNTYMTINNVANNNQKFSESLESLTEMLVNPLELGCTAGGAWLGKYICDTFAHGNYPKLFKAVGAVVGFIPSAIGEYVMTGKQKQALRVSSMLVVDEHSDSRKFVDYKEVLKEKVKIQDNSLPPAFSAFARKN